jgi:hypothetical protein
MASSSLHGGCSRDASFPVFVYHCNGIPLKGDQLSTGAGQIIRGLNCAIGTYLNAHDVCRQLGPVRKSSRKCDLRVMENIRGFSVQLEIRGQYDKINNLI